MGNLPLSAWLGGGIAVAGAVAMMFTVWRAEKSCGNKQKALLKMMVIGIGMMVVGTVLLAATTVAMDPF